MNELTPAEKINYDIRPAKSTQRRILLDQLKHVHRLYDLRDAVYVGFGATAFVDFLLFDRYLQFKEMWSIEKKEEDKPRYDFCKPLSHIRMKFGISHNVLNNEPLNDRYVLWLDYDQPPCADKLEDIRTVLSKVQIGSVLLMTLGLEDTRKENLESKTTKRLRYLGEYVAQLEGRDTLLDSLPIQIAEYVRLSQSIADDTARRRSFIEPCVALPIFRCTYRDQNPMLTIGWWLLPPEQVDLAKAEMEATIGYPSNAGILEVKYPSLTRYERKYVEQNFGAEDFEAKLAEKCIPSSEAMIHKTFYRFAPTYGELEW